MHLSVTIPGIPAPQGSKRHVGNGILVEASKRLKPWRADAIAAIQAEQHACSCPQFAGPVRIAAVFAFPRPRGHYRANGTLKPSAPSLHAVRPDLDKLIRALLDAATQSGIIRDDSQVYRIAANKTYAEAGWTSLIIDDE